jgi:4-amino-4-deoxy-L-arabinose transferase-like glycosyltransferase
LYPRQFFWTGVCLGVCILAKWHGLFLIPGIAVAILFMEMSFAQKVKNIVIIVGTALAFQYPVLLWNYQHDWVSFKYHLVNRHRGEWGTVLRTFGNGIGFLAGFIALSGASFIYLIAKYLRQPTKKDHDDYVLLAMGVPFLLVFGLSALKGESRIYWASFAFFPLSIFLLRKLPTMVQQRLQQISVVSCVLCMIGLSVGLYLPVGAYSRPVVELFRTYDMRLSPRGDTLGWKEWANTLSKEKILYVAADMRLASQLMWNSNLNFDQVTVIRPIKQYSIWQKPDIKNFAKVVFFGDNRRKLKGNQMDYVCPGPKTEKEYLNVRLLSEVVKVIEEVECTSNLVAN